jgi:hypothetical protein
VVEKNQVGVAPLAARADTLVFLLAHKARMGRGSGEYSQKRLCFLDFLSELPVRHRSTSIVPYGLFRNARLCLIALNKKAPASRRGFQAPSDRSV